MNGHVYGLSEIVGTSTQGVDDAIRVGVQRAARTLRDLDWFEVTDIRGHLVDGEIEHFQVTLKVGFRMEDPKALTPSRQLGAGQLHQRRHHISGGGHRRDLIA